MTAPVQIIAIPDIPEIHEGDDLSVIFANGLAACGGLQDGDILSVAHKVFSKAEGNVVRLDDVTPSPRAVELGEELNKDPRKIEVVLGQSRNVVRSFRHAEQNEGTLICEHRLGFISANAAVDESNVASDGTVITLPDDPDRSVRKLGSALERRFGCSLGVLMTDTFGRPWRLGQVNVAVGLYRIPARTSDIGGVDGYGRPLLVTEPALCDELAAASGLVVRKAAKTPLVLIRGMEWTAQDNSAASDILRARQEDMFR